MYDPRLRHANSNYSTSTSSSSSHLNTTSTQDEVRLIYAKSGFYLLSELDNSQEKIHGFFLICTQSIDSIDILICWIPEYLIAIKDIALLIELDGKVASDNDFPTMSLNKGNNETTIIPLKTISSLDVLPPADTRQGSICITSLEGDRFKPIWYSDHNNTTEFNPSTWPGYDIIDILAAFSPLQSSLDTPYLYLVSENIQPDHTTSSSHSTSSSYSPPPPNRLTQPILPLLPAQIQPLYLNNTIKSTCNEYQMASEYLARWTTVTSNHDADQSRVDALLSVLPELTGPLPTHTRLPTPLQPEEWVTLFDDTGRLATTPEHIQQLVFRRGLHPDIRIEAWKFLLGLYPWESTSDERRQLRISHLEAYAQLPRNPHDRFAIAKDVHRTDRTHPMFSAEDLPNPDHEISAHTNVHLEAMKRILMTYTGTYVQGMSDLLAPLYAAMGDEAMAFWVFSKWMERCRGHFQMDEMHEQLRTMGNVIQFLDRELFERLKGTDLFFAFRWLLVWFKREFEWQETVRLWEVLWTDAVTRNMVLFVAVAVVDLQREWVMSEWRESDEIYQYMNDLSGNLSLELTLQRAEVLFYQFQRKVRMMQHTRQMLKEQLEQRRFSQERTHIEKRIELLSIPDNLESLL